jgi:hypothetical protein
MGSGTTAVACIKTNRKYIGFELSEEYCKIAEKRIYETAGLMIYCNGFKGLCGEDCPEHGSEKEREAEKAIAAWNRRIGSDTNVPTNADRIRSMSDEELARFLGDEPPYFSTYEKYLDWLKQPVKED